MEIDTPILTAAVSGAFALVTALGAVWLKHHLDRPRGAPRQENDIDLPPLVGSSPAPAPPAASFPLQQSYNFRPLVVGLAGSLVGLAAAWATPEAHTNDAQLIALSGVVFFVCVWMALVHDDPKSKLWVYLVDVLVFWTAAFAACLATTNRAGSDIALPLAVVVFTLFTLNVLLGLLLIYVARLRRLAMTARTSWRA